MHSFEEEFLLDGSSWEANFFEPQPPLIKFRRGACNPELFGRLEASCSIAQPWRDGYRPQGWMKATLPGDSLSVSVAHGLVPDPMIARNAEGIGWINQKEWCFRRAFKVPDAWMGKKVELEALGLDYEAEVYLNGALLARWMDMFSPLRISVEGHLRFDGQENVLLFRFFPLPKANSYHYQQRVPERSHHLRAQVSVGWDTGRSIQSAGVWNSVRLTTWRNIRITDLRAFLKEGAEGETVSAEAEFFIEGDHPPVEAEWIIRSNGKPVASGNTKEFRENGTGAFAFPFTVPKAQFWWPVGMGEAHLYELDITVHTADGAASLAVPFGLRSVTWQKHPSTPDAKHALQCVVNGKPVFLHGMCWVPPDLRYSQINTSQYERLLELARHANFNLIRVWGGGLLEKRAFYDLCDKKGLLVWQEFPLACANYPSEVGSLERRRAQAESMLRSVRRHACLALWCGGNEMLSYGMAEDHPMLLAFGELVAKWHPECAYRPVSPVEASGEGHGPWGFFSHRFWNGHQLTLASEIGCPSFAVPRSVARMIPAGEGDPTPSSPKGFQPEDFGPSFGYRYAFLVEDNPPPPEDWKYEPYPGMTWHGYRSILGHTRHLLPLTLRELSFSSQEVQADSLSYVCDEYRRRWPTNSGLALWQFNESWPTLLYSIVDHYGVPKHAYYSLRQACQPLQVSIRDVGNRVHSYSDSLKAELWISNLTSKAYVVEEGEVSLWTWSGELLHKESIQGSVSGGGATQLQTINFPIPQDRSLILTVDLLLSGGKTLRRHAFYWSKSEPRAWAVDNGEIEVKLRQSGTQWEFLLHNTGDTFLGGVYLEVDDRTDLWSDNFLLLRPGEKRVIHLSTPRSQDAHWNLQTWSGAAQSGKLAASI